MVAFIKYGPIKWLDHIKRIVPKSFSRSIMYGKREMKKTNEPLNDVEADVRPWRVVTSYREEWRKILVLEGRRKQSRRIYCISLSKYSLNATNSRDYGVIVMKRGRSSVHPECSYFLFVKNKTKNVNSKVYNSAFVFDT